jgi:NAD(P)-dependent dehydrogenase (short-subunit alcohol dehydrogenase family)
MQLQDKVALITGGGSGLGQAMAILFARESARVVLVDREPNGGKVTLDAIHRNGGEAFFIEGDVSITGHVRQMVQAAVANYGRLDILVNNAGVLMEGTVIDLDENDWNRLMAVNLTGVFLCSKYAIPLMIAQGGGVILNMASTAGLSGGYHRAAYSASKGGLIALTRSMALDHSADGIRVNCLCPGPVDTPMLRRSTTPAGVEQICKASPLKRLADPAEIASIALCLVSEAASYVTGAVWTVDGGESLT